MPRNLFGKTSPHDSKSLIPLSRTTAFSLIANLSGDIAVTWELRIDTLPPAYPQGNPIFNDLRGQGYYSFGNRLPYTKD